MQKRLQGLCAQEEQQCARLEAHLREKVDSNQRLVESVHEKEGQIQFMRGRILGLQVCMCVCVCVCVLKGLFPR